MIRLPDDSTGVLAQPRGTIDDDKLIVLRQKSHRMFDGVRGSIGKGMDGFRGIQEVQSTGVLQQEALQQVNIKPVHVVDQFIKAVLMPAHAEAQGEIAERRMLIHQQDLLLLSRQIERQMQRQGGNSGSSFGPHQGDKLAFLSRQPALMPRLYMRQGVQYLVRPKWL